MNIIELWDNIKWSNIWIGVPKEKNKKEKGQEKKKIWRSNGWKISKLDQTHKWQIQEVQWSQAQET